MNGFIALQRLSALSALSYGHRPIKNPKRMVRFFCNLQWFHRPLFVLQPCPASQAKHSPLWLRQSWRSTLVSLQTHSPELLPWLFPSGLNPIWPEHNECLLNLHFNVIAREPRLLSLEPDPLSIRSYFQTVAVRSRPTSNTDCPSSDLLNALPDQALSLITRRPHHLIRACRLQLNLSQPRDFTSIQMTSLKRSRALRSALMWAHRHCTAMMASGLSPTQAFGHTVRLTQEAPYRNIDEQFNWPRNLYCLYRLEHLGHFPESEADRYARQLLSEPFCFEHLPYLKTPRFIFSVPLTNHWARSALFRFNEAVNHPETLFSVITDLIQECRYDHV